MHLIPWIPENAPFSAHQRLWLNGYLAGLFAVSSRVGPDDTEPSPALPALPLLILFGSQTGTAEKIARDLAREAKRLNCNPRVLEAAAYSTVEWKGEANVLVVTSTYGDGDMPDNAQAFWDWLQSEGARVLAHLNFSVLALGDSSYEHFCAAGKKIDARFEHLGAKRIHPRTDCDLDYESPAKAWIRSVLGKIAGGSPSPGGPTGTGARESHSLAALPVSNCPSYSRDNPGLARLVTNQRLSRDGSEKEARHYEFALDEPGFAYQAGDALGIFPVNCPELVDELLGVLGFDGEEAVPTPLGELPLRKALGSVFDITKPGAELLERLGRYNEDLRERLLPGRTEDMRKWLWGRDAIDLLLTTPQLRFQPAEFAGLLKKLAPRLYSIASSPKSHAGQVHLTVNTVRYESYARVRKGVGSTFLAERVAGTERVRVFVQPSPGFRLPENHEVPIIMVGPGTGVAPFRAFLHERRALGARGRNWLFFGEQHAATDFYYRDELEQMLSDGHLTRLATAFSRDQAQKVYVQHRMLENAAELWAWLQDGAHFYVCGDASRMAKDVEVALHKIAATAGGLDQDGAEAFVRKLRSEKRYQRDVY